MLLDLEGEAQQAHDLGHPGAGDALAAGDGGLKSGFSQRKHSVGRIRCVESMDKAFPPL